MSINPKAHKVANLFKSLSDIDKIYVLNCVFNQVERTSVSQQYVVYTEIFEECDLEEESQFND